MVNGLERMEPNQFFREGALAIYGNVEIDRTVGSCLRFLRGRGFAVAKIYVQVLDVEASLIRILTVASPQSSCQVNRLVHMDSGARLNLSHSISNDHWVAKVIEAPEQHPVAVNIVKEDELSGRSLAIMRLLMQNEIIGSAAFISEPDCHFDREDAAYLALLMEPLASATMLSLTSMQVLQTRDTLARLCRQALETLNSEQRYQVSQPALLPNCAPKTAGELLPAEEKETLFLDQIVKEHIEKVLLRTNGRIHGPGGAAELLGVNANTLRNKMDKLHIDYRKERVQNG